LVEHVVVVQPLPAFAACAEQVCTGTFTVSLVLQVVLVKLFPAAAGCALHVGTPTLEVVIAAGQVVVVQALAAVAPDGTQFTTGRLSWLFALQVMSTQPLPAAAVCGVQV
jgi:hypothetical protein